MHEQNSWSFGPFRLDVRNKQLWRGPEVLRLNPKFSLEVHNERVPIKEPAMLKQHIAALRKAGLK
jgi:hypothetical protein